MNALLNDSDSPVQRYGRLRVALELFSLPPGELNEQQQAEVSRQLSREEAIQRRILQAPEAVNVDVPDETIEQAINSLASRFPSAEDFATTLQHNGLERDDLYYALSHELRVEAVLEKLLASHCQLSEADLEIYYLQHMEKFELPETRHIRHILITINEEFVENNREQARGRIEEIASGIRNDKDFCRLAERYSECPTAMQQGMLGRVKPGQLFPSLDQVAFAMQEGCMSDVLESPLGFHLLWCEQIHPAERRSFDSVRDTLREHLEQKTRKRHLKHWLSQAN